MIAQLINNGHHRYMLMSSLFDHMHKGSKVNLHKLLQSAGASPVLHHWVVTVPSVWVAPSSRSTRHLPSWPASSRSCGTMRASPPCRSGDRQAWTGLGQSRAADRQALLYLGMEAARWRWCLWRAHEATGGRSSTSQTWCFGGVGVCGWTGFKEYLGEGPVE